MFWNLVGLREKKLTKKHIHVYQFIIEFEYIPLSIQSLANILIKILNNEWFNNCKSILQHIQINFVHQVSY